MLAVADSAETGDLEVSLGKAWRDDGAQHGGGSIPGRQCGYLASARPREGVPPRERRNGQRAEDLASRRTHAGAACYRMRLTAARCAPVARSGR